MTPRRRTKVSKTVAIGTAALAAMSALACANCSSGASNSSGGSSSWVTGAGTGARASTSSSTSSGQGGSVDEGASVLRHHHHPSRDGLYADAAFTRAASAHLHRDASFDGAVDGHVYAQVLYWDAKGTGKDLVIAATESNVVEALDAKTGKPAWKKQLGEAVALSDLPCGNIDPYGITGTPVIDYASRTLYVDALVRAKGAPSHQIYALSIDDGHGITGWPIAIADVLASASGDKFDPSTQGERGALLIVGDTLYVPFGGLWGDCGVYHGWLVGLPIKDPKAAKAWATKARGGGAWAPGGPASDGKSILRDHGQHLRDRHVGRRQRDRKAPAVARVRERVLRAERVEGAR